MFKKLFTSIVVLTICSVSLFTSVAFAESATNIVPNADLATADASGTMPLNWKTSNWSANTAVFSYIDDSHTDTDTKSIKVEITQYTSGDSKWYFLPQPITGGQYFIFSDYYKSNIPSTFKAVLKRSDGSTSYINLGTAPAAASWTLYSMKYFVPSDVVTVTVNHQISSVGYLITDDYSISPTTYKQFARGMITFTFDDGWASVYQNAFPLLKQYKYRATEFIVPNYIGKGNYMNATQLQELVAAGHDIGSHTVNHLNLTTLTPEQQDYELQQSKVLLKNYGFAIKDFALPFGGYNDAVIAKASLVYRGIRTSDNGFNTREYFNIKKIKSLPVGNTTTIDDVKGWIATAQKENAWLVLRFHQVDYSGTTYACTPELLKQILEASKVSGIKVSAYNAAINEILPQLP